MEVLYFLIPVSLLMAGGGLVGFVWAVRSGQFSDLASPGQKLLVDDFETEDARVSDKLNS